MPDKADFAHIPYVIVIVLAALGLGYLNVPLSYIGATGGLVFEFARQETKREYQIMEEKGINRSQLHTLDAWKFWNWNTHGKRETTLSLIAAFGLAIILHLIFGV